MMNMNKILPVVLVALILVSAVQAFQLNALKEKLDAGKVSVSTASSGPKVAAGGASSSASSAPAGGTDINSLPSMVGGC